MITEDDRDDLWELLGKAKAPLPSPFFSRNVLREVRTQTQGPWSWRSLLRSWRPAALGLVAFALLGGGWMWQMEQKSQEQEQLLAMAESVYESPDYSVINDLDELLDSEKNGVWLTAEVN